MRTAKFWSYVFTLAALAVVGGADLSLAADAPKKPDPAAEMAEWAKLNAPGPEHKKLAAMAGEWDTTCTMFMPDGGKMESKGKEKSKVVLGGRFLESEFQSEMMGMPFTGRGLMGYNTITKKWVMTWTDSMSTGITYFEGTEDKEKKTMTMTAEQKSPDGKTEKLRTVTTMIDENSYKFEMHVTAGDQKEQKVMEILYKRVK